VLLAQISDLHVTEPGQLLCGRVDTAGYVRRCVARLGALATVPDAVVITGDLVDRGTIREYETLRELLAPLTMPVYLLLGNHDDRAAFRAVFGAAPYPGAAGDFLQYGFDVGELRVLALDTLEPGKSGGTLCATRRAWLTRELDQARGRPVVIAMHHPPFATGIPFMDRCGLDRRDAAELAVIVAHHPNVERVICGHLHRSIHARFAGTIAATSPSPAHQLALGFTPDAVVGFAMEPPAFVQHVWIDAMLVSHHTQLEPFEGPIAY